MGAPRGMTSDWVRTFQPSPQARRRLVCLPYAGGSAAYYLPLAKALAPDVEVLSIQYPGRQDRRKEPFFADVQHAADLLLAELRPWMDDAPGEGLALFGHSLGATIGFELARRMERAGHRPLVLLASGRRAPRLVRDEGVHRRTDSGILAEMRMLGAAGLELLADPEVLAMVMPAVRADYRAAETYRYQDGPDLTCPIVAFTGDRDPRAEVDAVRAWEQYTTGPFELHVLPGGHFFLNGSAQVTELIRKHLAA